ncbi:cell division ATP-binding protein FtsE [Lacisediminimonas sp.]|uniref:cell division ATP-binding protein FtsE n=1 Tax=Lacisediminimonas sp. TaxID=3060582 RepID=UPI00271796D8|nr:ATP-binding cassette domain-containing protein [Lacisediminimonas sp.]MDO8298634.1 ATP-binding cassette domain-containing protein [Lacisediminimonas sp.]MDO9215817.1 ATP-binding cassette domain-containing protein [Lacisediminimonas sp.]
MINFDNVSKDYPGSAAALAGVNLQVASGELLFLTGPSGAGKSTLLKLIAAIEKPSSGAVLVGAQDIGQLRPAALPYLRRKLGLIFQQQRLLPDRSVAANVMLPLLVTGTSRAEASKRALAALEKVGLTHKAGHAPATLSGGEQQRATIARAIVHQPQIILADEPTANLDRVAALGVLDLLRDFNRAGVTCLVATHDRHFLNAGDRMVELDQGRIVHHAPGAA